MRARIIAMLESLSPDLRDLFDPPRSTREAIRRDSLRTILPLMTGARSPSQRSRAALEEDL